MAPFFQQIFTLLTTNPGNLTYHLILTFSIAWALQSALVNWRSGHLANGGRLVTGLSLLLVVRLALFFGAALAWQGLISSHLLPPLDRAANLLSLVIIIWIWAFPRRAPAGDAATILLSLLFVIIAFTGLLWWQKQDPAIAYNATPIDKVGDAFSLVLLAGGALVLLISHPPEWGSGLAMMLLLFLGYGMNLIFPIPGGDYSGIVRLAQMIAFPLLAMLPRRLPAVESALPTPFEPLEKAAPTAADEALRALLNLAVNVPISQVCPESTRTFAQLLPADVCLLVNMAENEDKLILQCGYNRVKERAVEQLTLEGPLASAICNALRHGRPLRLQSESTVMDMSQIEQALGASRLGHLLAAPIALPDEKIVIGLLLLNPYSGRSWSSDDQAYLMSLAGPLAQILQRSSQLGGISENLAQTQASNTQLDQIKQENSALLAQLETTRQQAAQEQARSASLAALVANQEEYQNLIAQLEAEIKTLKEEAALRENEDMQAEMEHLEGELRLALEEIARLKSLLSEVDRKQLEGESQGEKIPMPAEQTEVIISLSQELRQPMSSIVGYTDLLLGESVGILGALQRKFLERVKVSTERMRALLDDLVQLATFQNGQVDLTPETVDLNSAIDEAIAMTITQIREKNITLRVDLPERLPQITADRDAIQQILLHLLQNAGAATQVEGEISLRACLKNEDSRENYILVQVSDTGGGIPSEDLSRVFSRLYRADNPLIQGVGDTGVGLSIVKTLVEAHGGRIWVDAEAGKGSIFSLLLPVSNSHHKSHGSAAGGQAA